MNNASVSTLRNGPYQPRATALSEMATAVIILNEGKAVEYVNASAAALFAPVDPTGCTVPALLASCGARDGDTILVTPEPGATDAVSRLHLTDDRVLDCTARQLSNGGYVLSLDDVTDYVRSAELAYCDALTGLANRRHFIECLRERLDPSTASDQDGALLYIDLDRFKSINDTLGHPIGDALLRKVARRLTSALRDGDFGARLGGDEFAVIQSGVSDPTSVEALASRLVDLIGRTYALDGHTIHIGASIGVALFPQDGVEPDLLLRNADLALYRAKASGRGVFRFYETGMSEQIQAHRSLELDLRRALALKEFELAYQPQVNLETSAVVGFEALIRWRHAERGIVSPMDFVPLAEEIGIIDSIGEWVLRAACKQAATWPDPISVAVNLSPVQFRSGRLVETVMSALAHGGIAASRLELEITESALLDSTDVVIAALSKFRNLGIRVAMDDFGTGYSSLSYLQKFPLDKIKIDKSFIRGLDKEPGRLPLVRAITTLATSLGMKTTAEGVETDAELDCVRSEGCTEVQGYLTGRPLTTEAAAALVAPEPPRLRYKESGHEPESLPPRIL